MTHSCRWGNTEANRNKFPDRKVASILQELPDLLVYTDEACQTAMEDEGGATITSDMLCAGGQKGKDGCQGFFVNSYAIKCIYVLLGDSGGPLSWNNGQNQEVLIGVVSWGIGCAREGIPGVYAEVSGKMIFYPFVVGIAKHPQNF